MNPLITLIIGMLALASFVLVWAIGGLWAEVSDPARQRLSRLMSAQQTVMRATRGKHSSDWLQQVASCWQAQARSCSRLVNA